jgi:hypothetical protein
LGSSLFARHYSGSRGFFPFLWVLRCFSSPACLLAPYVFRCGYARITTREFPHSEIPGSMTGQRLPRAYRSRPRPSSALSAKASTVCPCSLDQKNTGYRCRYGVFKVHAGKPAVQETPPPAFEPAEPGLSKLNSVRRAAGCLPANTVEVDMLLGELSVLTARTPSKGSAPIAMNWRYP